MDQIIISDSDEYEYDEDDYYYYYDDDNDIGDRDVTERSDLYYRDEEEYNLEPYQVRSDTIPDNRYVTLIVSENIANPLTSSVNA